MEQKKLKNYILNGSLHTLSIRSEGFVEDIQEEVSNCISCSSRNTDAKSTVSVVNPNKLYGDVFKFSEFETVFSTILSGAGIKNYKLIRADFRLDSYDPGHYQAYAKLNRYLISMLAVTYKTRNNYRTMDLFSQKQLSAAIKNDYFEAENYDRAAKSKITENHDEPAQARLEERTISRSWRIAYSDYPEVVTDQDNMQLLKEEFTESWFNRWDKAIENVDLVHQKYNDQLEMIYKADKESYPTKFRSLTDFLIMYQGSIFCKSQMIDLLSRFEEVKDPKVRAENFKKRYGIEYFSKKDVHAAIDEVKRATKEFFDN